jgi:ABC-type branched-subunit amino acid transport system ATPase component
MNSAIRTEHLEKKFHRVEALRDLTLEVPTGAIYALVGPNGAGKTTAIKMLMNIFSATSGRAEVLGNDSRLPGRTGCKSTMNSHTTFRNYLKTGYILLRFDKNPTTPTPVQPTSCVRQARGIST